MRLTVLSFLPPNALAAVVTVLIIINTLAWGLPLYVGIFIKVLFPNEGFRRRWTGWLLSFTSGWTHCNAFIFRLAFAISTVPLIMAAMPVPEPPPDTAMATSGAFSA